MCYSGQSSLSLPRAQPNQPPSAFPTRFFLSLSLPLPWQVPQRNEPSGLEQDAQAAVDLLTDRVKFAAKRVACMSDTVVRFRDARGRSKAEEALAMSQAVPLQKVSIAASKALEHARAEASAARLRFESSSRSRRIIDYVKGKWNAEFRPLDVEEAERRVEEAVRALNSARQEEDRAWDLVYEHYNHAEAVSFMLQRAQQAHASAEHILADLKAALARAKHRAVRTAREVKDGRCLARKVYGNMGPLLVAARAAARSEDDSSGDQVWTPTVIRCSTP